VIDMPAKAGQLAPDTAAAEEAAGDTAVRLAAEARRAFDDAATRIEAAVQEGLTQLRAQSRVYADVASEHLDQAGEYVSTQVRERPLAALGAALGVGVLIGMLLGSGRR
jgi:ElaB/YqjD/DUF883 family membrane-anchored ribosome-binding protein